MIDLSGFVHEVNQTMDSLTFTTDFSEFPEDVIAGYIEDHYAESKDLNLNFKVSLTEFPIIVYEIFDEEENHLLSLRTQQTVDRHQSQIVTRLVKATLIGG